MIDLLVPSHELEPSKKPWPDRDWTAMPGHLLTPTTIKSMRPDTLHRDEYGEKDRIEAWELIHEMHLWARERNPGIPRQHGIYLLSASMGGGKSMWAIGAALMAWCHRAVPVFSSESMGALFGYRLSLEQVYNFPDVVPPGSIVLLDEIAALADAHSGQAVRGRVLHAGMTGFRKGGNLALTMTAAESMLAWQLRVSMEAVIEPYVQMPKKTILTGYSMTGKPQYSTYTLREHELKYPKFCYLQARGLRQPWQGRRVFEDYRADVRKAKTSPEKRRREMQKNWKLETVRSADPFVYDLAAKLYDTYQRVPISDQHGLTAAHMREASEVLRSGGSLDTGDRIRDFFRWACANNVFSQYVVKRGWIPFADLLSAAQIFDKDYFHKTSPKRFKAMVRGSA